MKRINKIKALISAACFRKQSGKTNSKDVLAAHIIQSKMVYAFGKIKK